MNQIRSALLALPLGAASTVALAQATAEPIRLGLIEGLSGPFANAGAAGVQHDVDGSGLRLRTLRPD